MLNLLIKLTLSIAILFYNFSVNAACLKEGDKVVLSGVMKEELFYGPPNWGEDRQHDEKITLLDPAFKQSAKMCD